MRSAFDGHIDEIPFILVDNFENDLNKNAYFLSHYHGDHVFGLAGDLFRRKLKKHNVFIYASKVTVAIIKEECPRLAPNLKPLELGKNTLSINTDEKEVFLNVTVLPAGHSLGSVMYLFEYDKKKILYTGDFRISRNSVAKYNHFHIKGEPIHLDVLYVDTTFQYVPLFPKRSEVVRNVVYHIKNWLNLSEKHRVVLLTSAGYGYECVSNQIYDETGLRTCVGESYWNIYKGGFNDHFQIERVIADRQSLHVKYWYSAASSWTGSQPQHSWDKARKLFPFKIEEINPHRGQFPKEIYGMTNDCSARILLSTKYRYKRGPNPTDLHIYFSAFKWGDKPNTEEDFLSFTENRIDVCFSTHCGRDELIHFINYFKPKKIVGFPNDFDTDSSLTAFQDGALTEEEVKSFKISPRKRKVAKDKEVRIGKKVCANVLKEALDW